MQAAHGMKRNMGQRKTRHFDGQVQRLPLNSMCRLHMHPYSAASVRICTCCRAPDMCRGHARNPHFLGKCHLPDLVQTSSSLGKLAS